MSQFVTLDQAKQIAAQVTGSAPWIGSGIAPLTDDKNTSGIFVYSWGGPYPPPAEGDALPYYFRFNNGNIQNNCGLVGDLIKSFPTTWQTILAQSTPPQNPPLWPI